MKYLAHFMFPNGGEKKNRIQNSIHHLALYLKDHPRTWIRGDRIAPFDFSHEVRPFGRENDPIFRGRSNDHPRVIIPLNHPSWEPILQGVPHRSEPLEIAHPPWHLVAVWPWDASPRRGVAPPSSVPDQRGGDRGGWISSFLEGMLV